MIKQTERQRLFLKELQKQLERNKIIHTQAEIRKINRLYWECALNHLKNYINLPLKLPRFGTIKIVMFNRKSIIKGNNKNNNTPQEQTQHKIVAKMTRTAKQILKKEDIEE